MELTTIINGSFGLLTAACLGFMAYGGWICLCHAIRADEWKDQAGAAPDTESVSIARLTHRAPLTHE